MEGNIAGGIEVFNFNGFGPGAFRTLPSLLPSHSRLAKLPTSSCHFRAAANNSFTRTMMVAQVAPDARPVKQCPAMEQKIQYVYQ